MIREPGNVIDIEGKQDGVQVQSLRDYGSNEIHLSGSEIGIDGKETNGDVTVDEANRKFHFT